MASGVKWASSCLSHRTSVTLRHVTRGERIKKARERNHMTQKKLAAAVGITERHVIRIEKDEHTPSPELAAKLAENLDIKLAQVRGPQSEDSELRKRVAALEERVEELLRAS